MISFILFSPVVAHWGDICRVLSDEYRILEVTDVRFRSAERDGYREFIHDLYPTHSRKRIERKCDDLEPFPYMIRIVMAEGAIERRSEMKERIRTAYASVAPVDRYITIHSSDTKEEARIFGAMTHPMNVRSARRRARLGPAFLARLKDVRQELKRAGIGVFDACIVDDAVLEPFGIRKAKDIDMIVRAEKRDHVRFGALDIVSPGYSRCGVSDDDIISNPQHHF